MCGLTGFCDFNKQLNTEQLLNANKILEHRGPNHGDIAFFETHDANIGLGHRRLSILDVSSGGNQPMYTSNKEVVIIFNGEIYNFKEIRKELMMLGYTFHSDSDTEVLLNAYLEFGIKAIDKFIGMFAFVLYDIKKQLLYFLRDRAGVKPLYYFYKDNCLIFASELKSIYSYPVFKKDIDEVALSLYFKFGYIPSPYTIFKKTFKCKPGHYTSLDIKTKKFSEVKYYDIIDYYNKPKLKISESEASEQLEHLLISAFNYRMVSDVPVGVFLSGGYDSSVVTAVLQKDRDKKIKTFTIGFVENKYNEANHAKKIAAHLGTEHHECYCTIKEAKDILPKLSETYDEPFGDSSAIPTMLVSQFAKKHVTVALSADGGDEIFAGYERYDYLTKVNNILRKTPEVIQTSLGKLFSVIPYDRVGLLKQKMHKFSKLSELLANTSKLNNTANTISKHFTDIELSQLLNIKKNTVGLYDNVDKINNENDFINTLLALDFKTYMVDDILVKVDKATMSVGLEGREPLLDHNIIEFVSQLPSYLKYNNGEKKYLLKKITHKYIPESLLDRPKSGFGSPLFEWLKGDLREYVLYYINEEQLSKHQYINTKKAISLRNDFLEGKTNNQSQIWLLLVFQMWWNHWM